MEVDWLKRIALGTPKEGEGHTAEHSKLCLAIIPWAPLPSGVEALERYVGEVEKRAGKSWEKVKGFRYLVQDKPRGTMLTDDFIEGLKWLGRKGLVFDLGVDQHSGGRWQLDEAVEMIGKAHEGVKGEEKVTFIISEVFFCTLHVLTSRVCGTNSCLRPSLQTRPLRLQPNRPRVCSLENSHVHTQQMQQQLSQTQRSLLRNARLSQERSSG